MQKSSFFNSVNGDRRYKAESWAEQIASFIGNGILANPADNLRVQADADMTVVVRAGRAWINGYFYWNTDNLFLTLSTADGVLKRIDRIVVRWSLSARSIIIAIKKGTPASNPAPPVVQRDADIYELVLADITVNKGAVEILGSNIADTRYLKDICGKVAPLFEDLDLSDFYEECSRNMMQQINDWEQQTAAQQSAWAQQTAAQQSDWVQLGNTVEGWYSSIRQDVTKLQTFDFDNLAALYKVERTTIRAGDDIIETITNSITKIKIAERKTSKRINGGQREITEVTKVYAENGVGIMKQATITTVVKADNSIVETVTGFDDYSLIAAYTNAKIDGGTF